MKNTINKYIWYVSLIVSLSTAFAQPTVAVSNTVEFDGICGESSVPFYTGFQSPPTDVYDVFVKLGRVGQMAHVEGYYRATSAVGACSPLGSVEASGDEWRKIGVYTHLAGTDRTMFQLSSVLLSEAPSANRPTFLLVSQNKPACIPRQECDIVSHGQRGYLRPNAYVADHNSLKVMRAASVEGDVISRVMYYVDNELMYTTKALEDFDHQSVPYYGNKLLRVIEYQSGQTIVIEEDAPKGRVEDLGVVLVRTFRKYENLVWLAVAILVFVFFVRMIRFSVKHFEYHREWMVDHGLLPRKAEPALTPLRRQMLHTRQIVRNLYVSAEVLVLVVIFVATTTIVLSSYVVLIGTIKGQSMASSYEHEQKVVIDRLPVTVGRINDTPYIPRRGEVVVAYPNFGANSLEYTSDSNERAIIKRVIGLPGERVVIDEGKITIYNTEHKDGFDPSSGAKWARNIQEDASLVRVDVVLAENEVFICGDNRPASIDSRYYGPISANQIVGVVRDL